MFDLIKSWFGKSRAGPVGAASESGGTSDLQRNAQKALDMKRQAGPQTHIPAHQTAHEGGVHAAQRDYTDGELNKEATYTSNLKRSHNARTGDGA
jgi:hypothetical protein